MVRSLPPLSPLQRSPLVPSISFFPNPHSLSSFTLNMNSTIRRSRLLHLVPKPFPSPMVSPISSISTIPINSNQLSIESSITPNSPQYLTLSSISLPNTNCNAIITSNITRRMYHRTVRVYNYENIDHNTKGHNTNNGNIEVGGGMQGIVANPSR